MQSSRNIVFRLVVIVLRSLRCDAMRCAGCESASSFSARFEIYSSIEIELRHLSFSSRLAPTNDFSFEQICIHQIDQGGNEVRRRITLVSLRQIRPFFGLVRSLGNDSASAMSWSSSSSFSCEEKHRTAIKVKLSFKRDAADDSHLSWWKSTSHWHRWLSDEVSEYVRQ